MFDPDDDLRYEQEDPPEGLGDDVEFGDLPDGFECLTPAERNPSLR